MARPVMNRIHVAARGTLPALAVLVALGLSGCGPSNGAAAPSSGDTAPSPAAGHQGAAATGASKSGTPATPAASAAVNPCAIVSRQEAEHLAGTSLNSPVSVAEKCTYSAPPSGPTTQVEVFVGETAKDYLTAERGIGHELRPLSGIGDEAYIEDYAVFVKKADFWVSIDLVRSNDPAENRGPLEGLARTVADRI
ncbi:hypothetical protein UK82_13400 [Frankia sp. ACN1ag]|nr:hypothetical protein UK82_13400 [Frankia sp. ACN1ag]